MFAFCIEQILLHNIKSTTIAPYAFYYWGGRKGVGYEESSHEAKAMTFNILMCCLTFDCRIVPALWWMDGSQLSGQFSSMDETASKIHCFFVIFQGALVDT